MIPACRVQTLSLQPPQRPLEGLVCIFYLSKMALGAFSVSNAGQGAEADGPSVASPSLVPMAPCPRAGKGALAGSLCGDTGSPGGIEGCGPGAVQLPAPGSPAAAALSRVGLSPAGAEAGIYTFC